MKAWFDRIFGGKNVHITLTQELTDLNEIEPSQQLLANQNLETLTHEDLLRVAVRLQQEYNRLRSEFSNLPMDVNDRQMSADSSVIDGAEMSKRLATLQSQHQSEMLRLKQQHNASLHALREKITRKEADIAQLLKKDYKPD